MRLDSYLFENNNYEKIDRLKKYLMAIGGAASASYFVLNFIVNFFIKNDILYLQVVDIADLQVCF